MRQRSQRIRAIELLARWRLGFGRLVQAPMVACPRRRWSQSGRPDTSSSRVEGAELRIWWHAAMDPEEQRPANSLGALVMEPLHRQSRLDCRFQRSALAHATALRSARLSGLLGDCRAVPVRPWRAVCCSGAGGACAERSRPGGGPGLAATLLQRLAHTRQLQGTVVLLGDVELLGCAVRVTDRQLIHLTRGDLGLVDVRNIHRDCLGSHWDSVLCRSAMGNRCGTISVIMTTAARHTYRHPISIDHSLKPLNYRGQSLPATRWAPTARSVDWCSTSDWSAPDGSGLLRLGASSVQTAPDSSRRIVWMIIWDDQGASDRVSDGKASCAIALASRSRSAPYPNGP